MEGTQANTGIIKICMGLESVAGMAVKSHMSGPFISPSAYLQPLLLLSMGLPGKTCE